MENEIGNVPPSTTSSTEILVEKSKPSKKFSFKNFLLGFFIVEHVILLAIIVIPVVFFIKTYTSTDFIELNKKAKKFTPEESSIVTSRYLEKYRNYIVDFVRPENEKPVINVSIEEKDLNSLLAKVKLEHIKKVYIEPDNGNIVSIWAQPDFIPYPLTIQVKLNYSYENKKFEVDILNWAIGSLSFPPSLLNFVKDAINKDGWNGLSGILSQNAIQLNKLETTKEQLNIEFQIEDKIKFTQNMLATSKVE